MKLGAILNIFVKKNKKQKKKKFIKKLFIKLKIYCKTSQVFAQFNCEEMLFVLYVLFVYVYNL